MRLLPRSLALGVIGLTTASLVVVAPARAATSPSPTPSATPSASASATTSPVGTPTTPGAPSIRGIKPGPGSGQLMVRFAPPTSDGGSPVLTYDASLDQGVTWWPCPQTPGFCTLTNLTNGRSYTVLIRAHNAIGPGPASTPATATPTIPRGTVPDKPLKLPKPHVWVNASFNAASNSLGVDGATTKLGVGTLPQLTFTRDIPDKAVVEENLTVKATLQDGRVRKVKGAWGWLNGHTVVFRPEKWWPGHATVNVTSTLDYAVMGKSGKNSVVGSKDLLTIWTFQTARKFVGVVDGGNDRMKIYIDGKKVKDFGVSLGKKDWETRNGVKVISTLKEPLHTYTSTSLNIDTTVEPAYELKDIPWNTRLTPTGEFIHSAPWAYGRIGRYNGSHGCTNMFESEAKWIYDKTIPGDVFVYQNTGGPTVQSWNGPGGLWNIPWEDWLKKSALSSGTGAPDTSNPAAAKPQDAGQSASA